MKKIQILTQKGGEGKTTSATNISAGLALKGYKTLAVDIDAQENMSDVYYRKKFDPIETAENDSTDDTVDAQLYEDTITEEDVASLGLPKEVYGFLTKFNYERDVRYSLYGVLIDDVPISEVIMKTKVANLDLVPAHIRLSEIDLKLATALDNRTARLKNALLEVEDQYDFIVIDTPPSLGLLTYNALIATDVVLIPVSAAYFGLKGLKQLIEAAIFVKKKRLNPDLKVLGVLNTKTDSTNVSQDVVNIIRQYFGDKAFTTTIPKNVSLEEAHSRKTHIFEHAPHSNGATAYKSLVDEILELEL